LNALVVGLQYGDEGKGKVVSAVQDKFDAFVRFNGGPNAGHTVVHNDRVYKFHHLPSGAAFNKPVYLDAGMVIDFHGLIQEIRENNITPGLVHVSAKAHLSHVRHIKWKIEMVLE